MTDARIRLLISGLISVMLILATAVLYVSGQEVPAGLYALVGIVMGFFFSHAHEGLPDRRRTTIRGKDPPKHERECVTCKIAIRRPQR